MVSLRQQYEFAKVGQAYETFAIIVSKALGGKDDGIPEQVPLDNMTDLMAAFTSIGGRIGG